MGYDRQRAEALNADHHRRMAQGARATPGPRGSQIRNLDHRSRTHILNAMLGCSKRHKMRGGKRPWVLEIGAGYGGDRTELLARFEAEYVGIEVVESVAQSAKHVVHMSLEECPEEWNGRFHYIYSRHVMEHVLDVPLAMKTLKRLLASNGIIGAVTPHYFPDPEPAHVTQLRVEEWMTAYRDHGLAPAYAVLEEHACHEAHIVAVHDEWPLQS